MAVDENYKIVDFKTHCQTCEHTKLDEQTEPCAECLEHPTNLYSNKPVKWKEKTKGTEPA